MTESRLSVRVNADIKQQAESVFEQLGLSLTAGVNIYLTKVARQQKIPFDLDTDEHKGKGEIDIFAAMKSMELQAQAAVSSAVEALKSGGLPVALYDKEKQEPYLLYPDGTKVFGTAPPIAKKTVIKKHDRVA
jgi:DNA-damage-inducible protein J